MNQMVKTYNMVVLVGVEIRRQDRQNKDENH